MNMIARNNKASLMQHMNMIARNNKASLRQHPLSHTNNLYYLYSLGYKLGYKLTVPAKDRLSSTQ